MFIQLYAQNKQLDYKIDLSKDWILFSSENLDVSNLQIVQPNYKPPKYYKTDIPKTVLATLVENDIYKNIYFDNNLEKISTKQFNVPWWYKKVFNVDENLQEKNYRLKFNGINYKANIWVNGKQIADSNKVEGAYGIFEFDITKLIVNGKNTIAVEIIPPKKGDLTIGFVDWNPTAPDNNMGLWRNVELKVTGKISISDTYVKSKIDLETLKEASLTIETILKNYSSERVSCKIVGGIGKINFEKVLEINPFEKRRVVISPKEFSQLVITNPSLWWPNNLGKPNLYSLELKVVVDNNISDKEYIRFGIREVTDYINDDGYRGYKINGKPILIKGAGWVDDLLLNDSDEKIISQIKYAKHINLNTIRLEGFWGKNKTLYKAADENGILLMVGWSCHWEWTDYCGRPEDYYMCITSPRDIEVQAKAYRDQVVWLRNHPSVFVWVFGSDKLPSPELEKKLNMYLNEVDPTRPILTTCKDKDFSGTLNRSKISGAPRVKMLGPYAYEPPIYWYVDSTFGGAYGFNTETGPGPQIPPLESLKKMLPENKLWPINNSWKYHLGRNEFETLDRYNLAFNKRYGKANNVEEYAMKSQISNYEAIRPMFEAFSVNKPKATGVIQWMFNSAWPEMFWQLFDYYLMPNGAFYGTRKANQPLNLVYNYKDKDIYVVNDYCKDFTELKAEIKILNKDSEIIYERSKTFNVNENISKKIIDIPNLPNVKNLYFVQLELFNKDKESISDNFYWLSTKEDTLEFSKSTWFYTPLKSYAHLTEINHLPEAKISYKLVKTLQDNFEIEIKNESNKVAFFIDVKVLNKKNNKSILPIFLTDNYFSLLPRRSKVISASFNAKNKMQYKVEIRGWNTNKLTY
jgi:exo-1,4-beta-D-glucosaminidase